MIRRILPLAAAAVFACAASGQTGSAPSESPVVGILNYEHAVKDLHTTLAFYHDVFGLAPDSTISAGSATRFAVLKIPNTDFGFELTRFSGVDRHPGQARPYDPGAAILVLRVKDLTPIAAAVKKRDDPVVTTSGAPVKLGNTRVFMVRDPDGFLCHIIELPAGYGETADGNVLSAAIGLGIGDKEPLVRFYHDLLGFNLTGKDEYHSNPGYFDMVGAVPTAQVREYRANVPGTKAALIAFYGYKDVDSKPFHLRVADPGAPAIALRVKDLDGLLAKMRAVGVPITTEGKTAWVQDPNGVNIELFEVKQ